ncbi:hypothetical protein F511_39368 [Dorcoceras hygrometricum]|uniref:Uncharacterized protein n=1 Tax=Dorcoceras hygrometricum TaxID=472368 RepID=A0A2Z7DC51_9LAMI|nr:hypothetical protein F511_39368 [Dorcoceras hygrometricum]
MLTNTCRFLIPSRATRDVCQQQLQFAPKPADRYSSEDLSYLELLVSSLLLRVRVARYSGRASCLSFAGIEATPFEEDSDLSGDVTPFSDSRFGVCGMTCPVGTVDFSYHGFSAGRGVDPAGNAPGGG